MFKLCLQTHALCQFMLERAQAWAVWRLQWMTLGLGLSRKGKCYSLCGHWKMMAAPVDEWVTVWGLSLLNPQGCLSLLQLSPPQSSPQTAVCATGPGRSSKQLVL